METTKIVSINEIDFSFIPPVLYKYRCWTNQYHRNIISEQQLFFSHPKEFEDLKDCNVPIDFDFSYKRILLKVKEDLNYSDLDSKNLEVQATRLYNERFSNSKKRRQRRSEFYKSMNDRLGIFSAARTPTLMNMWEKYSNYFDGFCVGFDYRSVALELGGKYGIGASEINYQSELPILIDPFKWDERTYERFIFQYVNNKESKWFDEDEFRLFLIYYELIYPNVGIPERQIPLPKQAFKEVIFGYKLNPSSRDEIYKAVANANLNVQFKEAQIADNQVVIKDL